MDFITKLPWTAKGFDFAWIIMDRLTKSDPFLAICESSSGKKLADLYVHEIVARNGIPVSIVFDPDVRFTTPFWQKFHKELGTRLHLRTAYHPQTDSQSERTIHTLKEMSRACVIDFGDNWDHSVQQQLPP